MDEKLISQNQSVYKKVLEITGAKNAPALAKKLNVARMTAYGWERGNTPIPHKRLVKLADEYTVSVDWFFRSDEAEDNGVERRADIESIREATLLSYAAAELDLLRIRIGNKAFEGFLIEQLNKATLQAVQAKLKSEAPGFKQKRA
jgi:transcriptional regulator with XRE-family HTH domain